MTAHQTCCCLYKGEVQWNLLAKRDKQTEKSAKQYSTTFTRQNNNQNTSLTKTRLKHLVFSQTTVQLPKGLCPFSFWNNVSMILLYPASTLSSCQWLLGRSLPLWLEQSGSPVFQSPDWKSCAGVSNPISQEITTASYKSCKVLLRKTR